MDRPQGGQASKRKPQKTEQLDEASEGAFAWMPGPGFTARPKEDSIFGAQTCSITEQGVFFHTFSIN